MLRSCWRNSRVKARSNLKQELMWERLVMTNSTLTTKGLPPNYMSTED